MATYYSNKVLLNANGVNTIEPKYLPTGNTDVFAFFTQPGVAFAANDILNLMDIPAGAYMSNVTIDCDQLDTNGTPTLTLSVGDATVVNRFISATTNAQSTTAAPQGINVKGVTGYQYTSQTRLQLKVISGPATGTTTGIVRVKVSYVMDP